jgi:hypothetical protein
MSEKEYTEIYERNINTSVVKKDEKTLITKASMLDLNHNMLVMITVDVPSKTIIDADARMVKCPFKICRMTVNNIKKIIGLKIERGINKNILNAIGRSTGCTHLYELSLDAIRLISNVMLGLNFGEEEWREEWRDRLTPDEVFIEKTKPFLKNTCLPYSNGTEESSNNSEKKK